MRFTTQEVKAVGAKLGQSGDGNRIGSILALRKSKKQ